MPRNKLAATLLDLMIIEMMLEQMSARHLEADKVAALTLMRTDSKRTRTQRLDSTAIEMILECTSAIFLEVNEAAV